MRVALASGHAGFELKRILAASLRECGHQVADRGTDSMAPVNYPGYAETVGQAPREARAGRGVLICGSGLGASGTANKLPGMRAVLCHDTYSARQGVEHDDRNSNSGAPVIGAQLAKEVVRSFLGAQFSGEERHQRRLARVQVIEPRYPGQEPLKKEPRR